MPQATTADSPTAETRDMPLQTRIASVVSVDQEARTFECVWTTGAPVRRFDWASWTPYMEELSLDPAHIRMGRLQAGAPLLDTHRQWGLDSVLGVVEKAWMEPTEGRSINRFSRREAVAGAWQDVADGIVRNISVGYIVHRYEKRDPETPGGIPTWLAIDWEPCELSLVPVGADAGAGVRAAGADAAEPLSAPTEEQRAQLRQQALQAVGARTYPCHLGSRSATPAQAAQAPAQATQPEPAAPAAGLGRSETNPSAAPAASTPHHRQGNTMDETTTTTPGGTTQAGPTPDQILTAERQRAAAIRSAVQLAARATQGVTGLDEAFINDLTARGVTVDQARAEVFARLEAHSNRPGMPQRSAAGIETVQDEQVQRRADMTAAVAHRAAPHANKLPESARRYRGYTLAELARRSLEDQGMDTAGMSRNAIVAVAMGNSDEQGFRALHGTSDFTIALANTVSRSLRNAYEQAGRTFTRWARQGTLSDFRAATRVAISGSLALEKVNEFGEFKRGQLQDSGETIQLATFGKVVGVTRQVVINDDLDFLSRLPAMYGRAAADLESDTVYGILKANAAMSDGVALFHANHGNLAAAGAAIGEAPLSVARAALRKQKDPGSNQPLNLVGRYILVGANNETDAQKMFSAVVVAGKTTDVNVFQNSYEIVVEPRLDNSAPTEWFIAADPSQIDTIEYAYLEGEEGLYTEQRMGFDVDGLEIKARLDFAAKAIDWRGIYKNPGA